MSSTSIAKNTNRAAAGILSAAVGVGVWGWIANARILDQSQVTTPTSKNRSAVKVQNVDSNDQSSETSLAVGDVWSRSLQSGFRTKSAVPVVERLPTKPPPAPMLANPQPTPTRDFGLRLVGTVIEKGRSMAIAIDQAGKLAFCTEGNSLQLEPEGVRVDSVSVDSVQVSFQGKASQWQMGQSLRFESGTAVRPDAPSTETPTLEKRPSTRKLTVEEVEEELEKINGNSPTNPL